MADPAALGARVHACLDDRWRANVRDVTLLVHSETAGAFVLESMRRHAADDPALRGLPARVVPFAVADVGSVGIDVALAAFAWGAAQVWTLVTHEDEAPTREAITRRMRVAEAVLASVGLAGEHLRIIGGGEVSRLAPVVDSSSGSDLNRRSGRAEPLEADAGEPLRAALKRLDHALQRPPAAAVTHVAAFSSASDGHSLLDLALAHLLEVAPS